MIYFVRHGQSQANVDGVFAGQRNDSELTDKGKEQARLAGKEFQSRKIRIDRIVSSPLQRALRTAEIIAQTIDFDTTDIKTDNRLSEYDMGALVGTPNRKVTSAELVKAEGAEDTTEFMNRVIEILKYYGKQPGNTLITTHAGVGRIIEAHRQGLDPNTFYDLEPYPNAHILELQRF